MMDATNTEDPEVTPRDSEAERIVRWRAEELERAGYDACSVIELANRTDVELHLAIELPRRGCPHETALRILL